MASPPYIYLKRDGSNANNDLNIDGYAFLNSTYISSPTYSGAKFGYNLLGKGDTQAASGSHNHPLSGLIDVSTNFNTNAYHGSGLKWNKTTGLWEVSQLAGGGAAVDNYTVKVDAASIADYIGVAGSDGVLRVDSTLSYTDGGNFVTIGVDESKFITSGTIFNAVSSLSISSNNYNLGGLTSIQETASGFEQVSHNGSFAHGLSSIPTHVNVVPSGAAVNFGVSCKVDASDIHVYMTATGTRDVYWTASV